MLTTLKLYLLLQFLGFQVLIFNFLYGIIKWMFHIDLKLNKPQKNPFIPWPSTNCSIPSFLSIQGAIALPYYWKWYHIGDNTRKQGVILIPSSSSPPKLNLSSYPIIAASKNISSMSTFLHPISHHFCGNSFQGY